MTKFLALLLLAAAFLPPLAQGQSCDDKLFPIVKDRKLGFIDKQGREVIPARFADYSNSQYFPDLPKFSEGLAAVSENGRWGYIDCSGQFVIPPKFGSARAFSDGVAAVREGTYPQAAGKLLWIDHTGRALYSAPSRQYQNDFHDGLVLAADDQHGWTPGYMNKNFHWAVPAQALFRATFHEGFAVFGVGNIAEQKFGFIDGSGKTVIPARYDRAFDFSDGLAGVCTWKKTPGASEEKLWYCGYVDSKGTEVIPLKYSAVGPFSESHAVVELRNGQKIIINKSRRMMHIPTGIHQTDAQFHEGLLVAKKGTRLGYIDAQGNWAIPPRFAGAIGFSHGLAMVQLSSSEYGYINSQGTVVWKTNTTVPPMVFIPSTFAAGAR